MQKQTRPSRRIGRPNRKNGSIMIMVVALLVLMALIGTAYIATARYDRGSAMQNADNVQVDLLLESVLNLCKTSVTGDLFDGNGNYRGSARDPFNTTNATITAGFLRDSFFYYNITSTLYDLQTAVNPERIDYWLADRTPAFGATQANSSQHYYWGRISHPLTTETGATGPIRSFFEDPTYVPKPSQPIILQFRNDTELEPTSIIVNGVPMPAFKINTGVAGLDPYTAVAADADGDGVADSFLVRLPIGTINGVTYYYAVRIVDNAAAINLNTAWGDQPRDPTNNTTIISEGGRLFPTSINLKELIPGPNQAAIDAELDKVRMFRTWAPPPYAPNTGTQVKLDSPITDADPVTGTPPTARTDFRFYDEHDALWMQLGRRPENPGFIPNSSIPVWQHYRAFPLNEMIALSPHFVLNYSYDIAASEGVFANSQTLGGPWQDAKGTIRTKPYAPDDINNGAYSWGAQNFNYTGNVYSRRPLLVTSNSVSNAISPHVMPNGTIQNYNPDKTNKVDVASSDMLNYVSNFLGDWSPNPPSGANYRDGDIVRHNNEYYICAASHSPGASREPGTIDGQQYWEYQPWTRTPQKASLNTATFRELYRAYWNVMCGDQANETPFGPMAPADPYTVPHIQKQFRSSLRDVRKPFDPTPSSGAYRFAPFQQLLLRSALAAVNTIDIRDSDDDVTVRRIFLNVQGHTSGGTIAPRQVEVTLYGCEKQPFITEVYAHTDNSTTYKNGVNKNGYVAIELFNPYDAPIKMTNWKLGLVDRRRPVSGIPDAVKHTIRLLNYDFPAGLTIPARSYLVLENYSATATDTDKALSQPPRVTVTGASEYVKELYRVFENENDQPNEVGGELVLLRPRRADGKLTSGDRSYDPLRKTQTPGFNENLGGTVNAYDLVPVDQFDFTTLKLKKPGATGATVQVHSWHYVRESGAGDRRWKCVYPGPYDAGQSPDAARHKVDTKFWNAPLVSLDNTDPEYPKSLPRNPVELGKGDSYSTYANNNKFPPIQINNRDAAGPYHLTGPNDIDNPYPGAGLGDPNRYNKNQFPFGGFQRVGDVMQVPFMGAYRVREMAVIGAGSAQLANTNDIFLELNSLPMDCAFAEDADINDDSVENIGRFCPILPELVPGSNYRYYDFAKRIFEYFTVIAPHDDYLPNVNPDRTRDVAKDNTTAYRYYDPNMSGGRYRPLQQIESIDPQLPPNKPAAAPQHAEVVKNIDPGTGSNAPEDNVGVHGLININTANWKVLSTVPFTPDAATNAQIAKAIVLYRDGDPATNAPANGPFRSLFDLYKVSEFINLQPVPITNTTEPDDDDGDFSPFDPTIKPGDPKTDGVVNQREFERQFILINRISNLLTTRSDSFTAYVIVQGWRNANTANAELVVQRRAAMLIDRAGVTRDNREPRTMLIPVE